MKKQCTIIGLGFFYSSLIAIVSFLFLQAEHHLIHWIWEDMAHHLGSFHWLFIVVSLLLGTVILYGLKQQFHQVPLTAHDMGKLRNQETFHELILPNLIAALLVLMLGAGVGPEATLLGIVVSLSYFQADKLRYVAHHFHAFKAWSFGRKLKFLFGEGEKRQSFSLSGKNSTRKKLFQVLLIINGLLVFFLLSHTGSGQPFVVKLGEEAWQIQEGIFLPLAALYGLLAGCLYVRLDALVESVLCPLKHRLLPQIAIGAVAIFFFYFLEKDLLFSGQMALPSILSVIHEYTSGTLLLLAIGKLLFVTVCLRTGWTGGDIFPLLFSAILQGFFLSKLLDFSNPLFIVACVVGAFLAIVGEHFWVTMLFSSLFFPLSYLPLIVGVGWLIRLIKQKLIKIGGFNVLFTEKE